MKKFWGVQSFLVLSGEGTECEPVRMAELDLDDDFFVPRKSWRDWDPGNEDDEPLFYIKLKDRVILDILDWCEQ